MYQLELSVGCHPFLNRYVLEFLSHLLGTTMAAARHTKNVPLGKEDAQSEGEIKHGLKAYSAKLLEYERLRSMPAMWCGACYTSRPSVLFHVKSQVEEEEERERALSFNRG
jgi:hypothetical protein